MTTIWRGSPARGTRPCRPDTASLWIYRARGCTFQCSRGHGRRAPTAHQRRDHHSTRSTRPYGRPQTRSVGPPGHPYRPSRSPNPHRSRGQVVLAAESEATRRASYLAKLDDRVAAAESAPRIQQSRVSQTWRATGDGDDARETAAGVTAAEDIGTGGTGTALRSPRALRAVVPRVARGVAGGGGGSGMSRTVTVTATDLTRNISSSASRGSRAARSGRRYCSALFRERSWCPCSQSVSTFNTPRRPIHRHRHANQAMQTWPCP